MSNEYAAPCGKYCGDCEHLDQDCKGCVPGKAETPWGKCRIAICCLNHKYIHCGQCHLYPCDLLRTFNVRDPNKKINRSLERLEEWREIGLEHWLKDKKLGS